MKLSAGFLGDGSTAGYEFDLALLAIAIHLVNYSHHLPPLRVT
ncbi:hypothetical protein [Alkalibacillus silvisoli]